MEKLSKNEDINRINELESKKEPLTVVSKTENFSTFRCLKCYIKAI